MIPHKGIMAAAATSADGMGVSKSGRALAFATSFTICLFAAGALAITLFGRGHGPSITLDLPESPAEKAKAVAREAWATGTFDRNTEHAFLESFGADLTPADHRQRLENLLYAEDTVEANNMLWRLDDATAAMARARIGLITSAGNVEALLAAVPPEFANDPGLLYDRIKWRRRHDQMDAARALLPQTPDTGPHPELMW